MVTQEQLDGLRQLADLPYFGRRRLGFRCDAQQVDLFRRVGKRTLLNCSRQTGKTTAAAMKAVHTALWRRNVTVLVTAPKKQQTREFMRKVRTFAALCGGQRTGRSKGDRYCVEFRNGSRIIGVAADPDSIRGFSAVALVIIDEASRVPDEVYYAILPMLAVSDGSMWILSTPKGKRGFFYEEWASPESDGWVKIRITAAECPRISPEFLAAQKKRMGERRFAQEFQGVFLDLDQGVFDPDMVRKAIRSDIKPLEF
jgi:phage terminase large subunit-like protein